MLQSNGCQHLEDYNRIPATAKEHRHYYIQKQTFQMNKSLTCDYVTSNLRRPEKSFRY